MLARSYIMTKAMSTYLWKIGILRVDNYPSDLDHLSADRFNRLAALIYDETGIKMPRTKATMLEGRLRRRLRDTGTATLDAYCDLLFADPGANGEINHLINVVTTNKTDFFREPGHFDFLAGTVLPTLLAQRQRRIRYAQLHPRRLDLPFDHRHSGTVLKDLRHMSS